MNNRRWIWLVAFILFSKSASSQISLQGRLIEQGSQKVVPFASVTITNSFIGTASDEDGRFFLKVGPEFEDGKIVISSLGYQNRSIPVDSLRRNFDGVVTIYLRPFTQHLREIVISGRRPEPDELLKEAIAAISENYSQKPFNLELYSQITVKDSLQILYQVESILKTYRKGYVQGASSWSRVLQKRERGTSPLEPERDKKTGKHYFYLFPGFDVFLIDQLGVGSGTRYTVFNPGKFDKMDFAYAGISIFDKDTVCAIEYSLRKRDLKESSGELDGKYNGVIYVALNNLAIVRHTLKIGHSTLDVIYKRIAGAYFPYSIQSHRPAYAGKKAYLLAHTVSFRNINQKNVEVIENDTRNWRPEDVEFNKKFWDENYPEDRNFGNDR